MVATLSRIENNNSIAMSKIEKKSDELLGMFSKNNITNRFVSFLNEEFYIFGEKKTKKIINILTKNYDKKNSINEADIFINQIDELFKDEHFLFRLEKYIKENKREINDFGKDFFYNNDFFTCDRLKNFLLAKIRRNHLSPMAINSLPKKDILEVLQVNNKFLDDKGNKQRIIDVKGRGNNKIYTLQDNKEAKMIDGKLVIQENINTPKTKTEVDSAEGNDTEIVSEDENIIENKKEKIRFKNPIIGESGKRYDIIEPKTFVTYARNCVKVLNHENNKQFRLPVVNGKVLDVCNGNDGIDYSITDYVSAHENTSPMDIVKIKDKKGKERNFRLLVSKDEKDFFVETQVYIQKKGFINFMLKNTFIKNLYRLIKKDYPNTKEIVSVEDFCFNKDNGRFEFTLASGEKVNIDDITTMEPQK